MSSSQRDEVNRLKTEKGWKGKTPPVGYELDMEGRAIASQGLISMAQTFAASYAGSYATVGQTQTSPMPPAPSGAAPPIPNTIIADNAGLAFGTNVSGSRGGTAPQSAQRDSDTVAVSTINGQEYRGHVYDRNGNRIT